MDPTYRNDDCWPESGSLLQLETATSSVAMAPTLRRGLARRAMATWPPTAASPMPGPGMAGTRAACVDALPGRQRGTRNAPYLKRGAPLPAGAVAPTASVGWRPWRGPNASHEPMERKY
jgi:hypothetical protein